MVRAAVTDIDSRVETARLLVELVDDYVPPSKRGGARRAIRSLLVVDAIQKDGCRRCGGPVDQKPGRGRPRVYCTTCSPPRRPGRKKPEK